MRQRSPRLPDRTLLPVAVLLAAAITACAAAAPAPGASSAPTPASTAASESPSTAAPSPPSQASFAAPPVTTGIVPAELLIPGIHVDAPVEQVGTTRDGAMDAPREWNDVAWFDQGYKPGQPGSAVIAGHLDSTTDKAVFWNLNKLQAGDKVMVKAKDGPQLTFQVVGNETYPFDQAPLQRIFGSSAQPMLNLVTCNGTFDKGTRNYDKRLVVYATLSAVS